MLLVEKVGRFVIVIQWNLCNPVVLLLAVDVVACVLGQSVGLIVKVEVVLVVVVELV